MTKQLTASVEAKVNYTFKNVVDAGTTQESTTPTARTSYTDGKGTNKANAIWRNQYTLTTGSPNQDIDLRTVEDVFGDAIEFEQVKSIFVRNLATSENPGDDIKVGPQGVANGFIEPWNDDADGVNIVQPGGCFLIDAPIDGFDVEDDEKVIRLAYDGTSGSIAVYIAVIGQTGDLEESSNSSSSSSSVGFSSSSSVGFSLSSSVGISSSSSSSASSGSSLSSSSQSSANSQSSSSSSENSSVSLSSSSPSSQG